MALVDLADSCVGSHFDLKQTVAPGAGLVGAEIQKLALIVEQFTASLHLYFPMAAADGGDILKLDSLSAEVRRPIENYLTILETTLVSWGKEEGPIDDVAWKEPGRLFVEHMGHTVQYIAVDKIIEHVKRRLETQLTETQLARAAVKLSEICRHATSDSTTASS